MIFLKRTNILMGSFSWKNLFTFTNKGLPNISKLPSSTTISRTFFICSSLLQSIILLFFILYFILLIYRVLKKINNPLFHDIIYNRQEVYMEEPKQNKPAEVGKKGLNENERQDQLAYRFDDIDEQSQPDEQRKEQNKQRIVIQKIEHVSEMRLIEREMVKKAQVENENEQNEKFSEAESWFFINLDDKFLLFQPLLIPSIICNNSFTADISTIILIILTMASYIFFNVLGKFHKKRIVSLISLIFSTLTFSSFFYNTPNFS